MIAWIIELSIRNRLLVLLLTAVAVGTAGWSVFHLRLDAVPDLSDVQVIIVTEYPGQNPQVVDDQVTYPLASAMLSVPGSTVVRGFSMFEQSFVYVLFDEHTDLYWARSRVLEYLNFARDRLPKGIEPKLGPDATGVGWVYQYALYPGWYCPNHAAGIWHDAVSDAWYAAPGDAPDTAREHLDRVRGFEQPGQCPLDGEPLLGANQDLAQLRSLQDWYLRYPLTAVDGVAEVAPFGGFVKQYQVVLDPRKMQAYSLDTGAVREAIQRSNNDVGGSVIEQSETEYMVRSRGYLRGLDDLRKVVVDVGANNTPVLLENIATLDIGGEARRGIGEYNGTGEAVGAIVIARFGENAYKVIQDVKTKLYELENGLPPGVFVKPTYDRSQLIGRAIHTLRHTLLEEILVVGLVCILFLLHARSELVAVFVVPSSVLIALLVMHLAGMNANIMSLGGIAIAIGVVVDSAIVMVENGHKHLDREDERVHAGKAPRPRDQVILEAAKEVGPQLFFSLLIITVSFMPIFLLGGEAGRLFMPLAFTKTAAMGAASLLSITTIPVLMVYFITPRVLPRRWGWLVNLMLTLAAMTVPALLMYWVALKAPLLAPWRVWIAIGCALLAGMLLVPQRIIHEDRSPISRFLQWLYEPAFILALQYRWLVLALALCALASTAFPLLHFGTEFMPPLDEGDLLYMPTTDPGISVTKARQVLQQTDQLIKSFPEVESVHGKIGRAETATDPAPLSMIETVVQLNPDRAQWRHRRPAYFYSSWPRWLQWPFQKSFWPESRAISVEELKYGWADADGIQHPGLNTVVSMPGIANAWPYPIENRLNMLATGIKTPVGIKILGPDLKTLGELADRTAAAISRVNGTASAYAERSFGGYYLDFNINREQAARYGLTTGDVQDVIQTAIGGMNITTTVEGAERYPLNMRYARELRDDVPALRQVLVTGRGNVQVPLGQLAEIVVSDGPPMIRSENAQHSAWVFVDIAGVDPGRYITEARSTISREVPLPPGYSVMFSGTFEFWEKAVPRLVAASLLTLFAIVLLLYLSSRSWFRVFVVLLAVPFSLIGAFWFLYLLGYNLSLAVVIGIIALAGLDAETGMVMLLYLDNSFTRFQQQGHMNNRDDLWHAVHDGAVKRIRPKAMTVSAAFIGLAPLLWASGTGADVMRRLAAPMLGGLFVSFLMELLVYPIIFYSAKLWTLRKPGEAA